MKLIREFTLTADQPCQVKRWRIEKSDIGSVIPEFGIHKGDMHLVAAHVGYMVDETTHPDGTVDKGFIYFKNSTGKS